MLKQKVLCSFLVPGFFVFGYVNIHVEGIVITSGPM